MTSDLTGTPPLGVAEHGLRPDAANADDHAAPDQHPPARWRRKPKKPETRAARRDRLHRAAGEAIARAAETNGDPVALMAAASGTDARYCDPVIRQHPLFSELRARFLMPEERQRLEHEARMAAAVAAEPGPVVWVRRQSNNRRSRRAAYRIADVTGLHWARRSGGRKRRVNRPFLYGYVWCDAMITGLVGHSCRHGPPPHHIKVCITKIDNTKTWREIESAAPPRATDRKRARRRRKRRPGAASPLAPRSGERVPSECEAGEGHRAIG